MNKLYGLTENEVLNSRELNGSNKINEAEPKKFWQVWLGSFDDPMLKLLIFIAAIMGVFAVFGAIELYDPVGIILSLLAVSLVSTRSEMKSDGEFRKLKERSSYQECKVYRDGKVQIIDANDLVVGDLVIVQSGEKVHADGFLFDGHIKVDNAALNGETEECKKVAIDEYDFESGEMTDLHMLLRGALCVDGDGVMKVVKVGMDTMMGKMAADMMDEEVDSPLKVKLTKLADQISKFGYTGSIVIAVALLANSILSVGFSNWIHQDFISIALCVIEAVVLAVTVIVMAVPEGLPLMISIVQSQNSSKMFKDNVLVTNDKCIEAAGSLNILFSDKTGTITKGKLQVVRLIDENTNEYESISDIAEFQQHVIADSIMNNTSAMIVDGVVSGGNMTDKALVEYVKDIEANKYEVVKIQTFNSSNKYMATSVNIGGKVYTYYKGAVEKLLDKCTNVTAEHLEEINRRILEMANDSIRVLSVAYAEGELEEGILPDDLQLVAVLGIRDDVRPEARDAIKQVQQAGVQVVMITGDRKETAAAIARDAGLINHESNLVWTSSDMAKMTDDEIKRDLLNLRVVARALPTDKSRLVRLAQELNLVAAMTGDGVNDSPALKRADVGFSMGSGTDAAKDAGDIQILDDNFKSIAKAILYGRTIYNNILKFIKFQLSINVLAVFICAVCPFLGIGQPLNVMQMLIVNMVMDSLGALALGGEPALPEYMLERPKSRTQSIVSKPMMTQVLSMSAFMAIVSLTFLFNPLFVGLFGEAHLAGYFALFMLMSVWNAFNVRSMDLNVLKGIKQNPAFIRVMGAITLVTVLLVSFGGKFLGVMLLSVFQWLVVLGLSLTVLPFGALLKGILRQLRK